MKKLLFVLLLFSLSCTRVTVEKSQSAATPTSPTTTQKDRIDIRVFGTSINNIPITIRHTSADGLVNTIGAVPYNFSFDSDQQSIFLFVEASGTPFVSNATLQVQIFVNGRLFRDATAIGFSLYAQASGTFRR